MKKMIAGLLCCALVLSMTACGSGAGSADQTTSASGAEPTPQAGGSQAGSSPSGEAPSGELDPNIKATLTFATWDNEAMLLYEELEMESLFKQKFPNVEIEIEEFKDDEEYFNSMKIRAAANELPDVMFLQPRKFPIFKEFMLDLSDMEAVKNNRLAGGYQVDGKIIGIPEKQGGDYVFYWSDVFEGAGVSVPKTWEDFVNTADKLQQHYGAQDPDFMALAMGAKDEWPVYPLMEYGPASFSGTGDYWDRMAGEDEPFAEGKPIRAAFEKVNALFSNGVLGRDPLGIGYDQALSLFTQKKAGMMIDSSLGLAKIKGSGADLTTLKSFYLPFTGDDGSFNHAVQGDFFMSIPASAPNPALSKAFVEFYFGEWYPAYIQRLSSESTMTTAEKAKDPYMAYADQEQPTYNLVMYKAGGDDYAAIVSETKFDYNKLGTAMLTEGFDLGARFDELNAAWKAARAKLGLA